MSSDADHDAALLAALRLVMPDHDYRTGRLCCHGIRGDAAEDPTDRGRAAALHDHRFGRTGFL